MGQIKHAKGLKIASIILGTVIALLIIANFIVVLFMPVGGAYNIIRCGTDFQCRNVSPEPINMGNFQIISDGLAFATVTLMVALVVLILVQARNTKLRGPGGRDYMKMEKPKVSDENEDKEPPIDKNTNL